MILSYILFLETLFVKILLFVIANYTKIITCIYVEKYDKPVDRIKKNTKKYTFSL